MSSLIDGHSRHIYLMPGEVVVASQPVVVSTILGSCIAVTMFSPSQGIGAICHAMMPDRSGRHHDLRYVDTAIHYIYRKTNEFGAADDLEIKLFGGSQVLATGPHHPGNLAIGRKNVARAQEILTQLGLIVAKTDVGGTRGRKLFFSVLNGNVYVALLGNNECAAMELTA